MKLSVFLDSSWPLIALSVLFLPERVRAQPENLTARIDSITHIVLENGPIAGLSIAVMQGGDTLHTQGNGWADIGKEVPATVETVSDLAFVTKLFTATAAMMLVENGKLSLNDELATLLPDFPNPEYGRVE